MRTNTRITNPEAERVLSGVYVAPGEPGACRDLAAFATAVRAAVPEVPDSGLETSLIPKLAEAAASATLSASRDATIQMTPAAPAARPRGWRPRLIAVAAAVALLPALMAGLAYAGVGLPDPIDHAFDAAGINLPNQSSADDPDAAGDGHGAGHSASKPGHEEGAAQPEAGSGDAHAGPNGHANGHSNGKSNGHSHGHGPSGATPPGHGGVEPGQGGVPPGNGGVPPGGGSDGATGPAPSAGPPATTPGHGGTPPGQGGTPPGQS